MIPPNPDYPARLEVVYPDSLSRLLIFVMWLLAIPHFIVPLVRGIGAYVVLIVSWFAVIITGRFPRGHVQLRGDRLPLVVAGWYVPVLVDRAGTRPSSGPSRRVLRPPSALATIYLNSRIFPRWAGACADCRSPELRLNSSADGAGSPGAARA
jgi:hypothetical protein